MIFKVPDGNDSRGNAFPGPSYVNSDEINHIQKYQYTTNNITTHVILFNTSWGSEVFKSINSTDATNCLNTIIQQIATNRNHKTTLPFIYDLSTWGIPTIVKFGAGIGLFTTGLKISETIDVSTLFHSDSVLPITYSVNSKDTAIATASVASGTSNLTITAASVGNTTVEVTATNYYGSITNDLNVQVAITGTPLVIQRPLDQLLSVGEDVGLNYNEIFETDSATAMTINSVSSDTGVATVRVDTVNHSLVITGVGAGDAEISATATIGTKFATATFNVTVS